MKNIRAAMFVASAGKQRGAVTVKPGVIRHSAAIGLSDLASNTVSDVRCRSVVRLERDDVMRGLAAPCARWSADRAQKVEWNTSPLSLLCSAATDQSAGMGHCSFAGCYLHVVQWAA